MTSEEKELEIETTKEESLEDKIEDGEEKEIAKPNEPIIEITESSEEIHEEASEKDSKTKADTKPNFLEKIKSAQKTMAQNFKPNQLENKEIAKEIDEVLISETERLKAENTLENTTVEKDEMITTCEALRALKDHLHSAPTPLFKKDYVLVHRNETLTLINTLVDLCNEDPFDTSLIGDGLIDKLSGCSNGEGSDEPLSLVKKRVQTILNDAMTQADLIVNDAKILSHQLLSNTEKKIQARYSEAETEINARMALTREESSKRLTEAKDSLTHARQQSEEILRKYLDKAEDDYEGYWERAEKHLEASHIKSLTILNKAVDIYKKELNAIKEDMQTLEDILRELEINRPKNL